MANRLITPRKAARDILRIIHKAERQHGLKRDTLLRALAREWLRMEPDR